MQIRRTRPPPGYASHARSKVPAEKALFEEGRACATPAGSLEAYARPLFAFVESAHSEGVVRVRAMLASSQSAQPTPVAVISRDGRMHCSAVERPAS